MGAPFPFAEFGDKVAPLLEEHDCIHRTWAAPRRGPFVSDPIAVTVPSMGGPERSILIIALCLIGATVVALLGLVF